MPGEDTRPSKLSNLVSVPGVVAIGILGALVVGVARFLGPDVVLREVLVEVVASFGSALLVIAVFGLVFRSGIERLIQQAPGGDLYEQSTERLREMLEAGEDGESPSPGLEERLDRIERAVGGLSAEDIPALRNEVRELRSLISDARPDRDA